MSDEGVLDPWVAAFFEQQVGDPRPDLVVLGRDGRIPKFPSAPERDVARVEDDVVEGVPIRTYVGHGAATGLVVYFHGGGFCSGGLDAMDAVARELAHHSGATVVSVDYRLSPQHPYPEGLDDCETVTRWVVANSARFDVPADRVAVAGESAGGNLATAVCLRLRDAGGPQLAGQALMYPSVNGGGTGLSSEMEFAGLILSRETSQQFWDWYRADRDLDGDPYAVPLRATDLAGLPPAIVVLGGCDTHRDAGRAYAARLQDAGVDALEVCYPGQPHGFMNFMFPAAAAAFAEVGAWLRSQFS